VRIDLVRTSTILLHVRLVPKIQPASCYIPKFRYRAPKTGAFTTRALLSRNYNARQNSLQLPNPDTRNSPSIPEPKGPLVQIGGVTFVTHPTFWTSASLSHASPPPIAPFSPFKIPGRHNLFAPAAKPHPFHRSRTRTLLPPRYSMPLVPPPTCIPLSHYPSPRASFASNTHMHVYLSISQHIPRLTLTTPPIDRHTSQVMSLLSLTKGD